MQLNNVQAQLKRAFQEKLKILLSNGEVGEILSIHHDNNTYGVLVKCRGMLRLLNMHGECQVEYACSVEFHSVLEHKFNWGLLEQDITHIKLMKSGNLYGRCGMHTVWERIRINPVQFKHLPVDSMVKRPVVPTPPPKVAIDSVLHLFTQPIIRPF